MHLPTRETDQLTYQRQVFRYMVERSGSRLGAIPKWMKKQSPGAIKRTSSNFRAHLQLRWCHGSVNDLLYDIHVFLGGSVLLCLRLKHLKNQHSMQASMQSELFSAISMDFAGQLDLFSHVTRLDVGKKRIPTKSIDTSSDSSNDRLVRVVIPERCCSLACAEKSLHSREDG